MKRSKRPDFGKPDSENPEWTKADFARAKPLRDVFPELAAYSRRRAKKGEEAKQAVSIRLSPDVLRHFKAQGAGWQTRIDEALRSIVSSAR